MKIRRLLILAALVLTAGFALRFGVRKFSLMGPISGHTTPLKEPIPAYTRSLRPNFPYSVIPGGAYSKAELRYADREDDVVKEHYADFDVKNARMVQLTEDKYQYVSYRMKRKVFWTKRRLKIPKGEVLLTDGASFARARCGNRLSEKPHMQQVSGGEPPAKALSMPPMQLGEPMELAQNPPLGDLSLITPIDIPRLQPVLPSSPASAAPPPEMAPLVPGIPVIPITPGGLPPVFAPPGTPPSNPPSSPPGSPPTNPPSNPPANPPVIPPLIPPDSPPVSPVPEPKAVYLFLVTFVLSLYGLTRMVPSAEKKDASAGEEGSR
jgi:hypothetical protein